MADLFASRRELFALAALPMLAEAASGKLPDLTMPERDAKISHEPFGELRTYFDGPTDQLRSMTAGSLELKPGMSPHPPHTHPEEEIMVVARGTGRIVIDGKTSEVRPGSMMYSAGGRSHGIVNTGQEPLLFYFFKWKAQA